ncbi:Group XVI phospholipase A2, partial [Aphelenchoides avenae]
HWGIVVAKHEEDRSVVVSSYTDRQSAKGKAVIREDTLEELANDDKCAVDNSLDSLCTPLSPAEILHRARSRLGEASYSLFENNCEHFASWCRNGIHFSHQAELYLTGIEMTQKIMKWRRASEMYDFVHVGDRVKFSRPLFEHWAVVVAKNEEDQSVVIIHSTEWQLNTGKPKATIREDNLEEVANGDKCAVDNSLDSLFVPLLPADIVQHSRSRIGETTYSGLCSNCEHFASWSRNGIQYSQRVPISEAIATGVMLIPDLLAAGPMLTPVVVARLFRTLGSQRGSA